MDVNKDTRMECAEIADNDNGQNLSESTVSTTPKLSKKERKALLASSKSFEKSLKNVITNPYPAFWPLVEKTNELFAALEEPLKRCCIPTVKLPLSAIKGKSKEERQIARREAVSNADTNVEEARRCRSTLAIGVNAVSKALERREVDAVIVSADVDPKLMAQHLIQLASQQSSVIVVPGFRQLTKATIGMEAAAVAFKSCSKDEENLFHSAVQEIKKLAAMVPKPASLPNLLKADQVNDEAEEVVVPDPEEEELQKWQTKEVRNWHLKRPLSGGKAFYPLGEEEKVKMEDAGEFIPLSKDDGFQNISGSSEYLPLRVKRVKPNKDKMDFKRAKKLKASEKPK